MMTPMTQEHGHVPPIRSCQKGPESARELGFSKPSFGCGIGENSTPTKKSSTILFASGSTRTSPDLLVLLLRSLPSIGNHTGQSAGSKTLRARIWVGHGRWWRCFNIIRFRCDCSKRSAWATWSTRMITRSWLSRSRTCEAPERFPNVLRQRTCFFIVVSFQYLPRISRCRAFEAL